MRFPGFEGEWEAKKLKELCEINPKSESLPDSFIYIDLESVVNGCLLKEDFILKDDAPSRAQRLLLKNDVLFQMVRPYQKNNLFFDKDGNYVASTGYAQIRTKNNSKFIFQYLHTQKFVDKVIKRCTGTSYPAINSKDLSSIKINFPTIKEQTKIAKFLTLIDNRIHTSNKIIEDYKTLKKGVMQKIFKQEIRFKDKDGKEFPKWQKKKLGLFLIQHNEKTKYSDQYPVLTSSRQGIMFQTEYYSGNQVASKDNTGYNVVPRNYFTYRHMSDDLVFKFNRNTICEKGIVSTLYPVFSAKNINDKFLEYKLNDGDEVKKYALLQKQGGSRTYLYFKKLSNMNMNLPCLEEQQKIAETLSAIDQKITLEEDYLSELKTQKKYLLQNLFV